MFFLVQCVEIVVCVCVCVCVKSQIGPLCAWKLLQARLLIFDEYLVTLKQTCPPPLSNGALESILVTDFDWKLTLLNRKLDCYVAELVCLRWQTQVNPEEEVLLANELSEFHRQTFGHSSCLNSLDSSTLAAHPPPTWPDTLPPRPRAPMAVFEDLVAGVHTLAMSVLLVLFTAMLLIIPV